MVDGSFIISPRLHSLATPLNVYAIVTGKQMREEATLLAVSMDEWHMYSPSPSVTTQAPPTSLRLAFKDGFEGERRGRWRRR
ncbi:hypothetical protein Pmani_015339 [Petrolisthes manimaculis]|uniref:Uncharacterized protein n=1 Tax=Petrolisthes manimaculis TaxID=1843537 RepID=A0AAE1U7G8_9EUCA|nr:hypothetical protein Pmani_015339 [Petrolisthes manimaculis]